MGACVSLNDFKELLNDEECIDGEDDGIGFGYLIDDIAVLISTFTVYRDAKSLTRLRQINKHWYQCLNPNKPNVNIIWENNICRVVFECIPNNLKMKRWDRYFQYKHYKIIQHRNPMYYPADVSLYKSHEVIEGCDYDIEAINSYHSLKSKKRNRLSVDKVDVESGLPRGFKWKLKCPVIAIEKKLKWREDKWYCSVCKKHVFGVDNIEELQTKVNRLFSLS